MSLVDFLIRVIFSVVFGFIIGFERQYRQRLAGIRTNVLVCVGACLFVMYTSIVGNGDTSRIAGQVVTGVGFLGGGVILREGFNVRGLNTAATLWCTASVGVLTSTGNIIFAAIASFVIVFSNTALRPIAKLMYKVNNGDNDDDDYVYLITIKCLENVEFDIRSQLMDMLSKEKILLRMLESNETDDDSKIKIKAEIISIEKSEMIIEHIIGRLSLEVGVLSIGWKVIHE